MQLKREMYDFLMNWRTNKHNECLLVKGARQIGKTYIIDQFGRENYESYIHIDFIDHPEFLEVFSRNLDAATIKSRITIVAPETRFIPGNTLIFLDEIQECPEARTALKYLAQDDTIDVIASGSLLGLKYKKGRHIKPPKSIPVGYEREIMMHSLSFREYLWAKGYKDEILEELRGYFDRREMVPELLNDKMHEIIREYIVVGGMPAVVGEFIETRHFGLVQANQEKLLAAYADDIHKYAESSEIPKIVECYHAIPRILAKENRKFKYSEVEKGSTARKYLASVEWLMAARMVSRSECVEGLLPGLSAYVREDWFKLYVADIGLLMAMYGTLVKQQILSGKLKGAMKGGIYENLIAGMLDRNRLPLYYFKRDKDSVEMEFVIEQQNGIVPVEVKSATGATLSLDKLLRPDDIPYGYKFAGGNVGVVGKKITMPHYMAMFVCAADDEGESHGNRHSVRN